MNNKMIGILVMTLLVLNTFPAIGIMNEKNNKLKEVSESSNMASRVLPERSLLKKFIFPSDGANTVDALADPETRKAKPKRQAPRAPKSRVLIIMVVSP